MAESKSSRGSAGPIAAIATARQLFAGAACESFTAPMFPSSGRLPAPPPTLPMLPPDSSANAPPWPDACWDKAMASLALVLQGRGVHPSAAVVLLPYAQLIQQARSAWALRSGEASFVPRFETTMNWASSLGGSHGPFVAAGDDLRMDLAVDTLTAASLLDRAGLAAHQDALVGRLVEAAWSVARLASAVLPQHRMAWSARLAPEIGASLDAPVLAVEAALGRIALAWAAASAYPSDRLFQTDPALLVVIEGFQSEPLAESLKTHFGERAVSIPLCPDLTAPASAPAPSPALYEALDAEDEAGRAAACVLGHIAEGRTPVALIAQDRVLTRRVGAMLAGRGIAMRDETGWKLSTTRAAASMMSLLRALPWDASTDDVLDCLKNSPVVSPSELAPAEAELRKAGVRRWRDLPAPTPALAAAAPSPAPEPFRAAQALALRFEPLRAGMVRPRRLSAWLRDLRQLLQQTGQWTGLLQDEAGQALLDALRLHEGAEAEFEASSADPQMKAGEFTQWLNQAVEGATFSPPHPALAQVVILPLAQLLGRPMQAVVLPGCDEIRLPASPEPAGPWTPRQREILGLPSREELAASARQAWRYAIRQPHVDLLWRSSEAGERLVPGPFVQELQLDAQVAPACDPRSVREVAAVPTRRPAPMGDALKVTQLSASAYEDLRRCPYRFFALRQLRLRESSELESELGKREFGSWLHSLLRYFHEALAEAPTAAPAGRVAMMDAAAARAAQELALSDAEFLPFLAVWPRVREGYLAWLADHEAAGNRFEVAESWRETPLGELTLVGQLDRIDRLPAGSGGHALVIDYKTEPRQATGDRVKNGAEDTQLAFYAALVGDDTVSAAYVNVAEREATRTYEQGDIVQLRDDLIEGILTDMSRIGAGAPMPALGEGRACDFCEARGLCRKDFWTE